MVSEEKMFELEMLRLKRIQKEKERQYEKRRRKIEEKDWLKYISQKGDAYDSRSKD